MPEYWLISYMEINNGIDKWGSEAHHYYNKVISRNPVDWLIDEQKGFDKVVLLWAIEISPRQYENWGKKK